MFNPDTITQATLATVSGYFSRLLQDLFIGGADVAPSLNPSEPWQVAIYTLSPIKDQIEILCNYANGEQDAEASQSQHSPKKIYTWDEQIATGIIMETIQSLCELLFCPPGVYSYEIPGYFWGSDLGQLILHCQLKVRGDELITISAAAILCHGKNTQNNRMKISRLIQKGKLIGYRDAEEQNPQHAVRVSRQQVMELCEGNRDE